MSATSTRRTFADVAAGLDEMTNTELTERLRELELQKRALEAEMAAVVDRADRRGVHRSDGHRSAVGWVRSHLNCSNARITQLRRCGRLFRDHPTVARQLHSGRIGLDHTAELARAHANPRCGEQLGDSLQVLLGHANRLKHDEFRQVVKRWEVLADIDGAHRDRGRSVDARQALIAAGTDGIDLIATGGTALQAAGMHAILDQFIDAEYRADLAEARDRLGDDIAETELPRTHAQRAFDALVKVFHTANNSAADDTPPAATVNIVVDQWTFEQQLAAHGLAAEPTDLDEPDPARARCHTDRGIPLLPHDTIAAALAGWIRRAVTNSQGVIIDRGRKSRSFTGEAADAARMLVTMCDLPGCTIPEHWCHIDHMTEWHELGETNHDNAAIACPHGNREKHRLRHRARRDRHGRVQIQRPDGTWITPVGADPPASADFHTPEDITRRLGPRWTIYRHAA